MRLIGIHDLRDESETKTFKDLLVETAFVMGWEQGDAESCLSDVAQVIRKYHLWEIAAKTVPDKVSAPRWSDFHPVYGQRVTALAIEMIARDRDLAYEGAESHPTFPDTRADNRNKTAEVANPTNTRQVRHESDLWADYQSGMEDLLESWVKHDTTGRMGYVYAIRMVQPHLQVGDDTEIVKIGRSVDPDRRINEITKTSVIMPYKIVPWRRFWAQDMYDAESMLHSLLRKYRLDGEWFNLPHHVWHALDSLWFISGYRKHGLRFRDNHSGAYHAPSDFFEVEIRAYKDMLERRSNRRNERPI